MLIEVLGAIKDKEIVVNRLEPIDEFLALEYDKLRFQVVLKCRNRDKTNKVKRRAIELFSRAVI